MKDGEAGTMPGHLPAGGAATWFSRMGLCLPLPKGSRRGEHSWGVPGPWMLASPVASLGAWSNQVSALRTRTDITHQTDQTFPPFGAQFLLGAPFLLLLLFP